MAATNIDPDLWPTGPDSSPTPPVTGWAQWVDDIDENGGNHVDTPGQEPPASPWCPVTGHYTGPQADTRSVDMVWTAGRRSIRADCDANDVTIALIMKTHGHTGTIAQLVALFRSQDRFILDGEWHQVDNGDYLFRSAADHAFRGVEILITQNEFAMELANA